jgi:sphingolipid delta-4 desaturase
MRVPRGAGARASRGAWQRKGPRTLNLRRRKAARGGARGASRGLRFGASEAERCCVSAQGVSFLGGRRVARSLAHQPARMAPPAAKLSALSTSPSDIFHDFTWVGSDEPHATRRKEILKAHPEMAELFGTEWRTFPMVLGIVGLQLALASAATQWSWWLVVLVGYVVGGTANHALQLAVHELSHNLCFETLVLNKLLTLLANSVTLVPSGLTFQRYHMEHHQYQGFDSVDTDIPTVAEVNFFRNVRWRKALWMFLQPAFYALRPPLVKPKRPTAWELAAWVVQLSFDYAVFSLLGVKAVVYLLTGTLLGLGLHPVAGHFIAEHYEFVSGRETYSYYGPLNYVNFNVGYHVEHHDFPKIPWSRLPLVRKVAPEFYRDLPFHTSYVKVIWDYIMNDDMGPFSRIKRPDTRKNKFD